MSFIATIFPFFVIVAGKCRQVLLLDSSLEHTSCNALLVYLADALICIWTLLHQTRRPVGSAPGSLAASSLPIASAGTAIPLSPDRGATPLDGSSRAIQWSVDGLNCRRRACRESVARCSERSQRLSVRPTRPETRAGEI